MVGKFPGKIQACTSFLVAAIKVLNTQSFLGHYHEGLIGTTIFGL